MKRVLGLDYGSKTVGVAVSDPLMLGATPLEIIRREKENHLRRTYTRISQLIAEYEVGEIVLGLPLNMDGSEGERAAAVRLFKEGLEKRCSLPVHLQDERLTTVEADEILEFNGIREKDRKKYIDRIAAQVILEDWMADQNYGKNRNDSR